MPADCQRGSVTVEGNNIATYDKRKDAGKPVTAKIHLQPAARFKIDVLSAGGAVLATKYVDTKAAPGTPPKQTDDTVYAPGGEVSAPHVVSIAAGEYTDQARSAKLEGLVAVEVIVGRDGKLREPSVVHGLGSGLDQKAIEAVMAANIRPGTKAGQPVAVRYRVNVDFKMPVVTAARASAETSFDVTHEHLLGLIGQGCSGRLSFDGNTMTFESSKHPGKFTKAEIYTLDSPGPGFIDKDRKRWKFHVNAEQKKTRQERNAALAKALDDWFHTK
jgi:protein TonB